MPIKLLFVVILISGCGNNVKLKENQLENVNPLTSDQIAKYEKSGILMKTTPAKMQFQGQQYTVSEFSSKQLQDFLTTLPSGSQTSVIFTGGTNKKEIVIESIRRQ